MMRNTAYLYNQHLYNWQGIDSNGQTLVGRDFAASETTLKYDLLKQQIIVKKTNKQHQVLINLRRWLTARQSLFFLSQLCALLKTGINLNKAVEILKFNQANTVLNELLANLHRQLNDGKKLSDILELYPVLFDHITIQLVKSGETTGMIDVALQQAVDYYGQKLRTLNQILTALLYPLMLGLVAFAVLATMTVFVIPQFETIYSQSNAQLPILTKFILNLSQWVRTNFGLLIFAICFISFIFYVLKQYRQIEFMNYVPKVNKILTKINSLRFCQTLAGLYKSGLPITACIEASGQLSSNNAYQRAIKRCLTEINNGHTLAAALDKAGYFDSLLIQLIKTGEESASLTQMLEQCAKYYEDQLEENLARLKILLEPLLIVFLGVIIGVILIAMYLPVFNLGASF